ncbi:MAG: hypothetical protein MZV64_29850 [Ignavibacteriales bacterium]|nr:hypothetical protein [Ignavibacteriales bacterium]
MAALKEPRNRIDKRKLPDASLLSPNKGLTQKDILQLIRLTAIPNILNMQEVQEYMAKNISPDWHSKVLVAKDYLLRSKEAREQINILGDHGGTPGIDYHVKFWKGEIVDFAIILQQDAFDKVDQVSPMERQKYMLNMVLDINNMNFSFESFDEVSTLFKKAINTMRQMNYSEFKSADFRKYEKELNELIKQ